MKPHTFHREADEEYAQAAAHYARYPGFASAIERAHTDRGVFLDRPNPLIPG